MWCVVVRISQVFQRCLCTIIWVLELCSAKHIMGWYRRKLTVNNKKDGCFNNGMVLLVASSQLPFPHCNSTDLICMHINVSYLLYSMWECMCDSVRHLQSSGCHEKCLKTWQVNRTTFHAQSVPRPWMISVIHAQWTDEPPLPLLLDDLHCLEKYAIYLCLAYVEGIHLRYGTEIYLIMG